VGIGAGERWESGAVIKWFSGQLKRKGEMSIQNELVSVEPETKGPKDDLIAILGY
jgi:hypothetical protein